MDCTNKIDDLRIVRGNTFGLRITVNACRMDGTPITDFSLADAEATLNVLHAGAKTEKAFVVDGNDAIINFDATLGLGWYGLEMSGTYDSEEWRWCMERVWQIVETNERANVPSWAFLTDDTYMISGSVVINAAGVVQADWAETDPTAPSFILNKPDLSIYATKSETETLLAGKQDTISDLNAIRSGAEKGATAVQPGDLTAINQALATIETVIPSAASSTNKLTDKTYVDGAIATNTANFVGTFDSLAELQAVTGATKNDYGFVIESDAQGNEYYDRYKYTGSQWLFEYKVESTPFTATQWAAIQSGITAALVSKLSALPTNAQLNTALTGKQDTIADLASIRSGAAAGAAAAPQATTYTKAEVDAAIAGTVHTGVQDLNAYEKEQVQTNLGENRPQNSQTGNMGYKILNPSKTFAEQITTTNTIYEIRDVFSLSGQTVTMPAGSVLKFEGGRINGGSIDLSACAIDADIDTVLFNGTEILAICINEVVYSKWFNFTTSNPDADIISSLISLGANIVINAGEYTLTKTITKSNSTLASINGVVRSKVLFNFNNCDAFDVRYFTISNITLKGVRNYTGIKISGSLVNIENCRIVTFEYGVYRVNTGTSILVNINNTNFEYCFHTGLYIDEGSSSGYTSMYKIIRNYFVKCGTGVDNTSSDGTTGYGYGIYLRGCNAVFIRYNVFEYCSCCGIYISPNTIPMRLIEVDFNTFEQNKRAQIILSPKSLYIMNLYVDHAFSTYPSAKVSNFLKEFYYGSDDGSDVRNIFRSPEPNVNAGNNKFFTIDYEHPLGYDLGNTSKYCIVIPNTLCSIVDGTMRLRKGAASITDFFLCYLKKGQTAYIEIDVATLAGSATSVYLAVKHGSQTLTITRSSNSTVRRNMVRITAAADGYVTMNGSYASGVSDDFDFSILPIIHKCPPYVIVESASERSYVTPVNFKGITIFDSSLSKLIYHNGSAWVNMDGASLN